MMAFLFDLWIYQTHLNFCNSYDSNHKNQLWKYNMVLNMFRVLLVSVLCLSLTGCGLPKHHAKTEHEFLITPGIGIKNLSLNDSIQHAKTQFSRDFAVKDGYLFLPTKGLDASYGEDGKIRTIFLYYKLPRYVTFDGITDKGIGKDSSIKDVLKAYGPPTREGDSIISEFGSVPGAHEHTITYVHQGIQFTFWDETLADIRVLTPK
ncbi:hypothetical protein [Pantoea ananatis]|uniref:Uncharacterized protein n=1 Tax=Pantoea ananatis (strain AJ13355) TaxID=932677 RepID=A0A0H3KV03_PANAA|nr:hypothetical protein [Pantoea ananatis]NQE77524.1 hypothetical protein [Pantoea ananatis]NQE82067.1 hypothetical protein [Pantoea ananatis]PKC38671.1 hypothetical protein V462_06475 [Pantoea ananatis 15320]BAK11009.1 hypothetical protein PAJ_0929 [Pantoea ananatis AJ13355]HCP26529.1 hypothetical protein [Pantoea ananatis]